MAGEVIAKLFDRYSPPFSPNYGRLKSSLEEAIVNWPHET